MHPGDGAGLATEVLPVADLAHGNANSLLLGELQITTGLVVAEGDGAADHGDLDNTALDLGHVLLLHRIIRCTEVHGLVDESLTAGAGTDSLVVDLRATGLGQVSEPTLVDLGGERRASTVQLFCGGGGHASPKGKHGRDEKSLLSEAHGRPNGKLAS